QYDSRKGGIDPATRTPVCVCATFNANVVASAIARFNVAWAPYSLFDDSLFDDSLFDDGGMYVLIDNASIQKEYENMVDILTGNGVDILLCETMSCIREAQCALKAIQTIAPHMPVWLSFTVNEKGVLRSGETLDVVCMTFAEDVDAILINCSTPQSARMLSHT
ncbi:MAG TPA: hypothetical protein EYO58_10240, partial [Flavobacteriales bacterium]|nr:hypothetical protein [Flavobacteriales bacterium]